MVCKAATTSPASSGRSCPPGSGRLEFRAGRRSDFRSRGAYPGFTLIELAAVLFIMGLMLSMALPYMGGIRWARLKSEARRLAGRATYLYDQAAAQKLVIRLVFDIDHNGYAVSRLDPYAAEPVFEPDSSVADRPIFLPPDVRIRDVTVEGLGTFNRGVVPCQFYPEGYVDATLIHLVDRGGHIITLFITPLTGQVAILVGDEQSNGIRFDVDR